MNPQTTTTGLPAWTFHPVRDQFYLHTFLSETPDLNLDDPKARADVLSALRFWLEKKAVRGFRINGFDYLFEDENNQVGSRKKKKATATTR